MLPLKLHYLLERAQHELVRVLVSDLVAADIPAEKQACTLAAERLEGFLRAQPRQASAWSLRALLLLLYSYVLLRFHRSPARLKPSERRALLRALAEPERTRWGRSLGWLNRATGKRFPSPRDLMRGMREMLLVAYYSHPSTNAASGYVPVWQRADTLAADPSLEAPPDQVPVEELRAKFAEGADRAHDDLFNQDGRPRVAVIGAGAGGAVVAARLARDYDVAVFEAGPCFEPHEYPLDTLTGMVSLYRDGLMTATSNMDVHLLLARLVGGGTALTSGMSIRPRKRTLEHWQRAGLDLPAMQRGLDSVERRLRIELPPDDLFSDAGRLWRGVDGVHDELLFEVPKTNTITRADDAESARNPNNARCVACGLCNYGCRFGHKLSVDATYLPDARAAGAKVHANLGVERLLARRSRTGQVEIYGFTLERDRGRRTVQADFVVLAAGAVGSSQLLLNSTRYSSLLSGLPAAAQFGTGLGFNYGTGVVADFGQTPPRPGDSGIQIHYVASKPQDESFVLENAFLPPALMSALLPGFGAEHRSWMRSYRQLSMAVTTIGSPQTGRVDHRGRVDYRVRADEMGTIHASLAALVSRYLRSGAQRVGLSGIRQLHDDVAVFRAGDDPSERAVLERLRRLAPEPDRLMLSSAHPQGGLRLGKSPESSAVGPGYNVHGVDNLLVADASLFPSTTVINPQWTVMGLAQVAAEAIATRIAGSAARAATSIAHEPRTSGMRASQPLASA